MTETALFETLPGLDDAAPLVVGIDMSLTASGVAWPDGYSLAYGISGLTKDDRTLLERGEALRRLVLHLGNRVLERGVPALALLEELPRVHLETERAYGWWALVNLLGGRGVHCVAVQPSQLKKYILGVGRGDKGAVIEAVTRRLPMFSTAGNDNRADAAVLCAMARDLVGHPLVPMPATNREVLAKLKHVGEWGT